MNTEKTISNLQKNRFEVHCVNSRADVLPMIKKIIGGGKQSVAAGGSVTLTECGVIDYLRAEQNFLDRYDPRLNREEVLNVHRRSFMCDTYFSGTNAITENGELYNVDGLGNRVSALVFGPKSVIIVAGVNKIVKDINEAVLRVKTIAAPKNAVRLNYNTYCKTVGKCKSLLTENSGMCDGCQGAERICCEYLISGFQRIPNRTKIILVSETLGY